MTTFIETIKSNLGTTVVDVAFAIIVLIVGLIIISWLVRLVRRLLKPTKIDATLKPFLVSLAGIAMKIILLMSVFEMAGIKTMSFVAVLAAASLAIGFAFQGALSNLAGGVLLLSLRPFHVGDYIEVTGEQGIVEAIHIFNTVLITLDNKVVSVPNGAVAGATVINFTERDKRRVDLVFGVSYDSNLKEVAKIIEAVANNHEKVDETPAPFVRLGNQGASSLDFTVRLWCNTSDYWDVYFDVIEQVTEKFNENNISIPFPQMDVHLDK